MEVSPRSLARAAKLLAAVAAAACIAARGGGGSGSDARCSDFSYQEDAQAAFNAGARQLDGDHDGIACESLPRRPAASPPPAPSNASAAGHWLGTTTTNRSLTGLVFGDGTYYLLYSLAGNATVLGGVVQGTGTVSGSLSTSANARDFNLGGFGVLPATLGATVRTKQSLDGILGVAAAQSSGFSAAYSRVYESAPSLAAIAGTYIGQAAFSAGAQQISLVTSPSGDITSAPSGCALAGQVRARSDANAYTFSISFGPAACFFAGQTLGGIGFLDVPARRLYVAAPNAARSDAFAFLGSR